LHPLGAHSPSTHTSPGVEQVTPAQDPTHACVVRSELGRQTGVAPVQGLGSQGFGPHTPLPEQVWPVGQPKKKQLLGSRHLASMGEHS
jgi:hypothetical protein